MNSFVDEDWSGLTHKQIYSQIVAELEEEQCRKEGHEWTPTYYCRTCGLEGDEALEGLTRKRKYSSSNSRIKKRKKTQK
jgi:hypothetical protein